jgi:folate-binding protein YgfZ
MFRLNYLSVLELTGADTGQFLQNQLSADMAAIEPGTAGFACACNPSGRVLGLLLVRPTREGHLAICAAGLADELIRYLTRYVLRSDVSIRKRDDLQVVGGIDPDAASGQVQLLATGGPVYGLLDREPGAACDDALEARWKASELDAGIAWLDGASSGQFLPQMLGAEAIGALSFKKGCYPGQEVIARTRYLGRLKRHPLLATADARVDPAPMSEAGLRTADGEHQAVIVDHAHPGDLETRLFLVARIGEFPAGARLEFDGREIRVRLKPVARGFATDQGWATT